MHSGSPSRRLRGRYEWQSEGVSCHTVRRKSTTLERIPDRVAEVGTMCCGRSPNGRNHDEPQVQEPQVQEGMVVGEGAREGGPLLYSP